MKTLIIGGTGFIGQHLTKQLAAEGIDLRVLGRHTNTVLSQQFEYMSGDFCDRTILAKALRDVDVVYHLAATTVAGSANSNILFDARTNLLGSVQLIQLAAEAGVKRFVFTSTGGAIYGAVDEIRPIPESHPTNPISAYAISKLAIEKYLEAYRREYGLEYRIARGGNPYGVGQRLHKQQGIIGTAFDRIKHDEELVIWGDGQIVRDFFHVSDFATALRLMRNDIAKPRVYNIGSGQGRSVREVIALMQHVTGKRLRVRYDAGRIADLPYNCLDISRIQQHLGWTPTVSMENGLAATWQVLNTNRPKFIPSTPVRTQPSQLPPYV